MVRGRRMNIEDYRSKTIKIIDDYLAGKINKKEASDWALQIIKSSFFNQLPGRVRASIYLIMDLHDESEPWCPTPKNLRECKENLINNSGPLPYNETKLKAKTTRGALKEIKKKFFRPYKNNKLK